MLAPIAVLSTTDVGRKAGSLRRHRAVAAAAVVFALIGVPAIVFNSLRPAASPGTDPAVALAEKWTDAAVAGDYANARSLTYDPTLGDRGLDGLIDEIAEYDRSLGTPSVSVANDIHPSSHAALSFVCFALDYTGYSLEGALVLREWDDQGLRVWEYRRMEGCLSSTATTIAPEPSPALSPDEILADGVVTEAEYRAAADAVATCVRSYGYEVEVVFGETGLVSFDVSSGNGPDVTRQTLQACEFRHMTTDIQTLWASQLEQR